MDEIGFDACYIGSDDYHMSEYVGDYFKVREFISGFTGSAGNLVITRNFAGLWTDGRYFIQAERELEGSGISLMKIGENEVPDIEDFLFENLNDGETLLYDGRTVSFSFGKALREKLAPKHIKFVTDVDIADGMWDDRPEMKHTEAWNLPLEYSGKSSEEKMSELRERIKEKGADGIFISSLDDICWLYNIRAYDIDYTPVALRYALITDSRDFLLEEDDPFVFGRNVEDSDCNNAPESSAVFTENESASNENTNGLTDVLRGKKILFDPETVSEYLADRLKKCGAALKPCQNPTTVMKAVKNPVEIENMRKAHIKDGAALTKTIYWLKKLSGRANPCRDDSEPAYRRNITIYNETELTVERYLTSLREKNENYISLSFESIVATGEHGAIVHYAPTGETDRYIEDGLLLIDTGAHYLEGTTDVTRTVFVGTREPADLERKLYTAVLKGHIDVAISKYNASEDGSKLDESARKPLKELGYDFNHGTGHGVGYLLSVHEGPNAIRRSREREIRSALKAGIDDFDLCFRPGMITSDEPGVYLEGMFGIRIENLVLSCICGKESQNDEEAGRGFSTSSDGSKSDGSKNEEGMMCFESLTLVPYDKELIDTDSLNDEEMKYLVDYSRNVYEKLSPFMTLEERKWLYKETHF